VLVHSCLDSALNSFAGKSNILFDNGLKHALTDHARTDVRVDNLLPLSEDRYMSHRCTNAKEH